MRHTDKVGVPTDEVVENSAIEQGIKLLYRLLGGHVEQHNERGVAGWNSCPGREQLARSNLPKGDVHDIHAFVRLDRLYSRRGLRIRAKGRSSDEEEEDERTFDELVHGVKI